MLGLTTLGAFHTAIGLLALVCGFIALARVVPLRHDATRLTSSRWTGF